MLKTRFLNEIVTSDTPVPTKTYHVDTPNDKIWLLTAATIVYSELNTSSESRLVAFPKNTEDGSGFVPHTPYYLPLTKTTSIPASESTTREGWSGQQYLTPGSQVIVEITEPVDLSYAPNITYWEFDNN